MQSIKVLIFTVFVVFSCSSKTSKKTETETRKTTTQDTLPQKATDTFSYTPFNREQTLSNLKNKKANKEPLIVHLFVPLCDNNNQGIVPVNASLGNGKSLRTNLYWGAGYGVKSYFKKVKDWKLLTSQIRGDKVLERVVFKKIFQDNTEVYLIADAYSGDQMELCLKDYIASLTGEKDSILQINDTTSVPIYSKADLVIFNGHNGLMDVTLDIPKSKSHFKNETVAIACYSHSYFKDYWLYAHSYPIVSTTHLLAPEAYTIEAIINSWALGKSGTEIRNAAAKAYSDKHTCSYKTGQKLFKTGW